MGERSWFYVYALMNIKHNIYVGYTHDLEHRANAHNQNVGAVATTKAKGPWFLFYAESYRSDHDARKRELEIIRTFENGVFLKKTYNSRALVLREHGLEHKDWTAKIINQS